MVTEFFRKPAGLLGLRAAAAQYDRFAAFGIQIGGVHAGNGNHALPHTNPKPVCLITQLFFSFHSPALPDDDSSLKRLCKIKYSRLFFLFF